MTGLTVTAALRARRSCREFLPTAVPQELLREILDVARWAPPGGNLQPWKVIVVAGAARDAVMALARERISQGGDESLDRPVYPPNLWEPYRTRRFQLGEELYALLGIERSNRAARLVRFGRNYQLFGAPVGMFFIIDERMGFGQWAHLGMFMQSIALTALERGVSSCMQESWAALRRSLHAHFALPAHELVYCGMALGYADPDAVVNTFRSERAAVETFAEFRGFQ